MSNAVVVVGSINADLNIQVHRHPKPGETVNGSGGTVLAGGKGANQACVAARLGADVTLIGAVGTDQYAHSALSVLKESGANLEHICHAPGTSTGLAVVTLDHDGENSIVVIPGANARVDAGFVSRHIDVIESAAVVVLQGEIPLSGNEAAASYVRGRLVVNPAPVIQMSGQLLSQANPLVVNEHEAIEVLELYGRTVTDPSDYRELAVALLAIGPQSAVITLGGEGAVIAYVDRVIAIPATKAENVVDTTGAGDAFVGSLAFKLAQGKDLETAARYASRVGSYAVQRFGAQASYPHSDSILPQ